MASEKRMFQQVSLALLVSALFVGTQMPGAWRDWIFSTASLPWQLTKVAHFGLFFLLACVVRPRPIEWSVRRVLLIALMLSLLTEGLQHFAKDRDLSWADVGIDMAGAVCGLLVCLDWRGVRRWMAGL